MGTKLNKNVYPAGHTANDFKCFGPPALKDGDFTTSKIADLGCFTQDGKDTNKYYHGAICQSKINSKWYVYFQWGRTLSNNLDFQFVECSDESDAQKEYTKQLMSKNVKRGEWVDIGGIKTLRAKAGEDCYLVRAMAVRDVGLPDGKTITVNDKPVKISTANVKAKISEAKVDKQTLELMKDLNVATVSYARTSMSSNSLPTQGAIDEARIVLIEAQKRIASVGDDIDDQISDKQLIDLTNLIYSRIPKKKPIKAAASTWILSANNILNWQQDLDAFESAGSNIDTQVDSNPFGDIKVDMEWISDQSELGKFIHSWWPTATGNKHSYLNKMKILNAWRLDRHEDKGKLQKFQTDLVGINYTEKPLYQPKTRGDLVARGFNKNDISMYEKTNTALLFHGTRTVNVSGILRKNIMLPKQLVGVRMNGALFGPGIYWADDWKKSAGYTSLSGGYYTSGDGSIKNRGAFMFAGDVVLGNPYVADYKAYSSPPKGHHSVFGKAGKSGIQNNEWIIYNDSQFVLRYLVEFTQ